MTALALSETVKRQHVALAQRLAALLGTGGSAGARILRTAQDPAPVGPAPALTLERAAQPALRRLDGRGRFHLTYRDPSGEASLAAALAALTSPGAPIAADPESLSVLALAERLAASEIPVLIAGPTGTGKEVLSRFIHDHSPRREGPFVAINPQGGDLARDSGARAMRSAFAQLASTTIMPSAAPGQPRTLGELGLATNRDGSFRFDPARLTAMTKASPTGVTAMFTAGIHGVFATIDRLARNASTSTNPGSLGGSLARYTNKKTDLTEERSALAEAQEALRAQLTKRFAAADSRVGTSRSTLSFLQGQIDAWNAGRD
jgi:hypothetical protein